ASVHAVDGEGSGRPNHKGSRGDGRIDAKNTLAGDRVSSGPQGSREKQRAVAGLGQIASAAHGAAQCERRKAVGNLDASAAEIRGEGAGPRGADALILKDARGAHAGGAEAHIDRAEVAGGGV